MQAELKSALKNRPLLLVAVAEWHHVLVQRTASSMKDAWIAPVYQDRAMDCFIQRHVKRRRK